MRALFVFMVLSVCSYGQSVIQSQDGRSVAVMPTMLLSTSTSFSWYNQSDIFTSTINSNRIMFSISKSSGMSDSAITVQVYQLVMTGSGLLMPQLVGFFSITRQSFWFIQGVPAGSMFFVVASMDIADTHTECSSMCAWQINMQFIP